MIDLLLASTIKLAQALPVYLEYTEPIRTSSTIGGRVEHRNPMPVTNITIDYRYMQEKVLRTDKYVFSQPSILKPKELMSFSLPFRESL